MPSRQLLFLLTGLGCSHSFLHPNTPRVPFSLHPLAIDTTVEAHRSKRASSWKISFNDSSVDSMMLPRLEENEAIRKAPTPIMMEMQTASVPMAEAETLLHCVSLISGTTIGAGILALPAVTYPSGFLASTIAMTVGYVIMTLSGLYIAELSLGQQTKVDALCDGSVLDLYAPTEQPNGALRQFLSIGAYFFLHYAMMVAYISQGGSNIIITPPADILWPPSLLFGPILFTTIMANVQHPEYVLRSFPIILLSFVYHTIIPTVVKDCQYDVPRIQSSIVGGTTLPFLLFAAWNAVILGNVDPTMLAANAAQGAADATIDPVAILLKQKEGSAPLLHPMISIFSTLAVMTSLIGFTYGLQEAWTGVFLKLRKRIQWKENDAMYESHQSTTSYHTASTRLEIFALIFLPPLLIALYYPDIFVQALDYGGAFGVTILFVLLPAYGVWMKRYGGTDEMSNANAKQVVPGGKVPILGLGVATGLLLVQQVVEKLGFLFEASSGKL